MTDLTAYDLIRIPTPECEECAGTGETEDLVRFENPCMGGAIPAYIRDDCPACRGEGVELCHKHRRERAPVIACHADEATETYCGRCITKMVDELEIAEDAAPTWELALETREVIETLGAILTSYEMENGA